MSRRAQPPRQYPRPAARSPAVRPDAAPAWRPPDIEDAEPVEVGRYLDAFRRSRLLIVLIVVPLTVGVYLFSASRPERFRATPKLVF
jgi:uncharacterized protein involved in exopolysaccharide biosynthesis